MSSSRCPERARQIVDVTLGRDETRGFAETRAVAREDTQDAIARGVIKPERVPVARRRGLARHSARRCGDRATSARVQLSCAIRPEIAFRKSPFNTRNRL
jgi:hypothetical protein